MIKLSAEGALKKWGILESFVFHDQAERRRRLKSGGISKTLSSLHKKDFKNKLVLFKEQMW